MTDVRRLVKATQISQIITGGYADMAVLEMEIGRSFDHLKEVSIDLKSGNTAITLLPIDETQPGQGIELSRGEFLALAAAFRAADAARGHLPGGPGAGACAGTTTSAVTCGSGGFVPVSGDV